MIEDYEVLDSALDYCGQGWKIFPVGSDKIPLIRWTANATSSVRAARHWFTKEFPTAQIGLACGARSGVVVVDIDRHGGADGYESLKRLTGNKLPQTPIARTPSDGLHLFFQHPGKDKTVRNSASQIAPAIDVKADGGYVLVELE
jgi:hypothetical protein